MNKIILAISLFCFSSHSYALQNGVVTSAAKASAGAIASAISAQVGANAVLNRTVTVSAASANAALIRRMLSPGGLLITAAILALGYYLDQSDSANPKLVTTPVNVPSGNGSCGYTISGNNYPTFDQCYSHVITNVFPAPASTISNVRQKANTCEWWMSKTQTNNGAVSDFKFWWLFSCTLSSTDQPVTPATPLTQEEITTARENQTAMSPRDILTDSGVADRQVPEISGALDDMEDDYQKATDTNVDGSPNTTTQPDTDPASGDTGVDSQTSTMPTEQTEQKTDCDKYPNAIGCAATDYILDDYTDPGPPELDTLVLPFDFTPTMSSVGSCPSPLSDTLSTGQVVSFSFDMLCTAASMLRPLVIAIAYLVAAYLVAGYVRGGSDA